MSEEQPPGFSPPRCSGMALAAFSLGLFSGPIWMGLFFVTIWCGDRWFPDAPLVMKVWGLGLLLMVQGVMLLISVVAWVRITRAQGMHGRGFVVIGLALAAMWTMVAWSFAMGLDF